MRGASGGGDSRAVNNVLETINAAATAIALAENRVPQASARVQFLFTCTNSNLRSVIFFFFVNCFFYLMVFCV